VPKEANLYARVGRFARTQFGLWLVKHKVGTRLGNIDVVGVHEAGSHFSSSGELFAIEVKEEGARFLASVGQALAYTVYVHYPYLAVRMRRRRAFSQEEKDAAAGFGVGLIAVGSRRCTLISTARRFEPEDRHVLHMYSRLAVFRCSLCGSVFKESEVVGINQPGAIDIPSDPTYAGAFRKAIVKRKHVRYWVYELARQRKESGSYVFDRRYICRDCSSIFASLIPKLPGA